MKVLFAIFVSLIVGAVGQPTPAQRECFDDYYANSDNAAVAAMFATSCTGVNLTDTSTEVCSLSRVSPCFLALNAAFQACGYDVDADCLDLCFYFYGQSFPEGVQAIGTACNGVVDFESQTPEQLGTIICGLDRSNACFQSLLPGYRFCNFDIELACLPGCIGPYLTDNPMVSSSIETSCSGTVDLETQSLAQIAYAVCSLDTDNSCYTSLQPAFEACSFDTQGSCVEGCTRSFFDNNPEAGVAVGTACANQIDFLALDREEIASAVCELGPSSPCYAALLVGYNACQFDIADVCEKLAATTMAGSVRVYAVPVFVLISALLSVLF